MTETFASTSFRKETESSPSVGSSPLHNQISVNDRLRDSPYSASTKFSGCRKRQRSELGLAPDYYSTSICENIGICGENRNFAFQSFSRHEQSIPTPINLQDNVEQLPTSTETVDDNSSNTFQFIPILGVKEYGKQVEAVSSCVKSKESSKLLQCEISQFSSPSSRLVSDIKLQLTRSLCLYRGIGQGSLWVWNPSLDSPITCFEDLIQSGIINFARYFHSGIDFVPKELVPYYDFWDSMHNTHVWSIPEFEDFIARYFFSLSKWDYSIMPFGATMPFFENIIISENRPCGSKKTRLDLQMLCQRINSGHLEEKKVEHMLGTLIGKRLPDEVVSLVSKHKIPRKSAVDRSREKARIRFMEAVRQLFPHYKLLKRFFAANELNFAICVDGKDLKNLGIPCIQAQAYISVKRAIGIGKLDNLIMAFGYSLFFPGEIESVKFRAATIGISLEESSESKYMKRFDEAKTSPAIKELSKGDKTRTLAINFRFASVDSIMKQGNNEKDEESKLRNLFKLLCPTLSIAPRTNNNTIVYQLEDIKSGKCLSEVDLDTYINAGQLDKLFVTTGTALLGRVPYLVMYGNRRIKLLKEEACKRGDTLDKNREKKYEENQVRLKCTRALVSLLAALCEKINEYIPLGDPSDAFVLMERLQQTFTKNLESEKMHAQTPIYKRYCIPSSDEIIRSSLFPSKLLKLVRESLSPQLFQHVVRMAYTLRLGRDLNLHTTVFTGAGLATGKGANLPTVRGSTKALKADSIDPSILVNIRPTVSHMIIKALMDEGYVAFVCSQNIENLHRTSGIPKSKLWEVHGNLFDFECSNCGAVYDEDFPPPVNDMLCTKCSRTWYKVSNRPNSVEKDSRKYTRHSGTLRRRVVRRYGENIIPPKKALAQIRKTQISIVIGSTLKVGRLHSLVCPASIVQRPLLVVINKGPIRRKVDNWATRTGVRIDSDCDTVLSAVASLLELKIPQAPKVSRPLLAERGEAVLDFQRIFYGERNLSSR